MPRAAAALLLAATLSACTGPMALLSMVPWTPLLSTALASRDGDPQTRKQLNEMQVKGDWPGVIRLADAKLATDPANSDWLLILGYAHLQSGNYATAARTLEAVIKVNPEDIDAWNLLAATQRLQGQEEAAARTLAHAVSVDPSSPVTPYLQGEVARETGHLDQAVDYYHHSVELDDEYAPGWYGLGRCFIELKRDDDLKKVLGVLRQLNSRLAADLEQQARAAGVK